MIWLTVKLAVMDAIPATARKPSVCRIADESSARVTPDVTTTTHENARPMAKPVPALRSKRIKKAQLIFHFLQRDSLRARSPESPSESADFGAPERTDVTTKLDCLEAVTGTASAFFENWFDMIRSRTGWCGQIIYNGITGIHPLDCRPPLMRG
jgi:hypothetical protein